MNRITLALFVCVGSLAFALAGIGLFDVMTGSKPYARPPAPMQAPAPARSREEILAACDRHVREAEREAHVAIDRRVAEFVSFINQRKSGAAVFSDEIVSPYGKWRALKAHLPFTDSEGHRQYVEEQFAKRIFSNQELAGTAERIVTGSLKDLEEIENRLAVNLRREISDRPVTDIDVPAATAEFAGAIERVTSASQWDAAKASGSLVVSEFAAVVGTQVLLRLGISAGVLATGTASSVWTLGASLVLGLIADAVWQWFDDPAGDIERETVAALDQFAADGSEAIRAELGNVLTARRGLWGKAVEEMVP